MKNLSPYEAGRFAASPKSSAAIYCVKVGGIPGDTTRIRTSAPLFRATTTSMIYSQTRYAKIWGYLP